MIRNPAPLPTLDCCLFLDVDGTLIEFTDTPFDTCADSELKGLLTASSARLAGALALVSGRSIEYLDTLFAPVHLPTAGLHGVERRGGSATSGAPPASHGDDSQLAGVRTALTALVASHPGALLEDKGKTIAVHFRTAPGAELEIRESVTQIAATLGAAYHVQAGNMMLEIKPCGFSKGGAIDAFMQELPFSGRRPIFIGDDLTDLDGFRVVERHGGLSIGVGDRVQGMYQLEHPAAVRDWLKRGCA